jgi:hypothetical protein
MMDAIENEWGLLTELTEIDPGVKASVRLHESGCPMIAFRPFRPADPTVSGIKRLIASTRSQLAPETSICRICLDSDQTDEKANLESIGFKTDGINYLVPVPSLLQILKDRTLPAGYTVRKMHAPHDLAAVTDLEIKVHAADPTSRVSFDSEQAIAGMQGYYTRAAADLGVFLLTIDDKIVGVLGLMPDRDHAGAVHVSSVSIATDQQGLGLFFPFLASALECIAGDWTAVTGTTTTRRVIAMAEKYSFRIIGVSVCNAPDTAEGPAG